MLTTSEVVKRLGVPYQTIVSWLKRGLLHGATREETPRGPVWLIPASALDNFQRPVMGRPPKPEKEKAKAVELKSKRATARKRGAK